MTGRRTSRQRAGRAVAGLLLGLGLAAMPGCSDRSVPPAKTGGGSATAPPVSAGVANSPPAAFPAGGEQYGKRERPRLSPAGEAALREGAVALQQGRPGDAARAFRRAVRSDPASGLVRDYLGIAYLQQRDFAAALRQFREGARLEPHSAVPWARIADVYVAQRDLKHAVQALERGVELDPDNAQLQFNLGVLYPQYLQLARGVAAMRRCVELEPNNAHARFTLAGLLMKTARLDEAQQEIERAIALRPDAGEYHLALGRLLLQRRVTPETSARALSEIDRALALGVEQPGQVHFYRGLCLQRQGKWEESREALQRAVALAPEAWSAYHALGTSLLKLGRSTEARAALARFRRLREQENARMQRSFFEQEVDRNRDDPGAFYQFGAFLESRGDVAGAVRALRQAAELAAAQKAPAEQRLRIHRRLEAIYRQQGLRREAEAERARARRLERRHAG